MSIRPLLDSELPFSGIASSIEDRNDYDMVILNREINSIWKSSRQGAPDARSKFLVLEWAVENAIIRGSNFIQKFKPQFRLFGLVPFERRLNVGIRSGIREKTITAHSDLGFALEVSARRSSTSKAECARTGSWR